MKGTQVIDPKAIPNWELTGFVEYIKSGQKQGDMLLIVPDGAYAVRLGENASIKTKVKVTKGLFYSVTFNVARTCAQEERLNVSVSPNSEPNDWGILPMQTIYSSNSWDAYSWGFLAEANEIEIVIHHPGVEKDHACGPLIDSIALKALFPPRRTNANMLKNGDFEEGPYVLPKTGINGVLIPPNIEDDHSPLLGWMIESLKAVKYLDAEHFAVPQGKRAIELIAGKESAIAQIVKTIPEKVYALSFVVGDANNACEGSMIIEAFAGENTLSVPYDSKGKGGYKQAVLKFKAETTRTRIRFLSTFYTMKTDGSLCGPIIDAEQTEQLSLFFNTSEKQKKEIEKALSEAWAKFPGNKEVKAYIEQYRSHYKEVVDIEIQEERGDVQNTTGNAEKNTEGVESGQSEKEKDVGLKFVRRVQKKQKKVGSKTKEKVKGHGYLQREPTQLETIPERAPEEEHVEKDPKEGEQEIDALINKIAGGKKNVEKVVDKTLPSFDFGSPFDSGLESSQSSQELIKEGKETSLNIKEKITTLYKQSVGNTIQEEHENATEADKDGVGKENTEMGASEKKTEKFKSNAGKSVAKGELGVERSEWKPVDINRGMGQQERVAWQYLMSFAETQEKLTEGNEKNSKIETDSKKSENDEDELEKKRMIEEEKAEVAASFA
ncbi:hypothetical protein SSX86_002337 [Deinandra increscens subsp. villosa]|uniref:DUF642 domain-containing protein n=1 Tax=Deinandra increscens subsp. villosa TaxID=3103831 RepID=A0AAP0DNE6_9ASTR